MEKIRIQDSVSCQVDRNRQIAETLDPHGFFTFEHIRNGVCLSKQTCPNVVTVEGKNFMLNATFQGVATTEHLIWYMGLIDAVGGWGEVDEGDVYAGINLQTTNLWNELTVYTYAASGVNRGTWDVSVAAGKTVTSSTQTQFDITGAGTIKGAFLCAGAVGEAKLKDDATVGAPANILFSASVLSGGNVVVANADTFKVTYTVST